MITPKFLTTAEEMAERMANHERDRVPAGSPLVMTQVRKTGKTPHARHHAVFIYADGSEETYGPIGGNDYGWTREAHKHIRTA